MQMLDPGLHNAESQIQTIQIDLWPAFWRTTLGEGTDFVERSGAFAFWFEVWQTLKTFKLNISG